MKAKKINSTISNWQMTKRKNRLANLLIQIACCLLPIVSFAQYTQIASLTPFNGEIPKGSLISDGTYLYGMASFGGINEDGTIFKVKPDGTSFTKLHTFSNTNGQWPTGSLVSVDSFLYGMTPDGNNTSGNGIIFKVKPDGTGYVKLHDFIAEGPSGSLIYFGGFLYGMTHENIFKIKKGMKDLVVN